MVQLESHLFGSQTVSEKQPQMVCTLIMNAFVPSQVKLTGLLDTGADVTTISQQDWPNSWPLVSNAVGVMGLGGVANSLMSAKLIMIANPENQRATVRPYVTSAPLNLWGRDCLRQWGVRITTD